MRTLLLLLLIAACVLGWLLWERFQPVTEAVLAPPPPAATPTSVEPLLSKVGPVTEPRNLLLARVWQARWEQPEQALINAEKLAARYPTDPAALGLLAELRADAGTVDATTKALVEAAKSHGATHPGTLRATAALALAEGRFAEGLTAVATCEKQDPNERVCAWYRARLLAAKPDIEAAVEAYAALDGRWPGRGFAAHAAVLAAEADLVGAEARVAAVKKQRSPDVEGAAALLAWRNGQPAELRTVTPDNARDMVALAQAARLIQQRRGADALRWLERWTEADPPDLLAAEATLALAQARYLVAKDDPSQLKAAIRAADTLLDRADPAAVQVRTLVAALEKDSDIDAIMALHSEGKARDIGLLYLARAQISQERRRPQDARDWLDRARRADPVNPLLWLWSTQHDLAFNSPATALSRLEEAPVAVTGLDRARNPWGGAMPLPIRENGVLKSFLDIWGQEEAHVPDVAYAQATILWLSGHYDDVEKVLGLDDRPRALTTRARTLIAQGRAQAALPIIEELIRREPRQDAWHWLMAEALIQLRRFDDARAALAPYTQPQPWPLLLQMRAAPPTEQAGLAARVLRLDGDLAEARRVGRGL